MNRIKLLSLVVTAVWAVTALIGTSAMAESTALCETDPGAEACSTLVTHAHSTSVGKAKMLSSSLNVECDVLFLGTVGALGSPQLIEGSFTYSNCNNGCTIGEENGPSLIEVLRTGHETAAGFGEGLMHVNCSGFINCRYNGVGLKSTSKGPLLSTQANGEGSIQEQAVNKESGTLCPSTGKLDITMTALNATYIGE
jgi:hypothetical protein